MSSNKVVNYTNLDTNTNLSLEIDKKMIFVYGKNGTGKTTLSRSKDLDSRYVFNEDFIYNNVYVIESEGAKMDSNIKNNFSGLLIGEKVVSLKKEQDKYVEILKNINELSATLNDNILKKYMELGISNEYNPLKDIIDNKFKYDLDVDLIKQFKSYTFSYELPQEIRDEISFKKYINQIKKQENLVNLVEKIKNVDLLYEYLITSETYLIDEINNQLKYIREKNEEIEQLEQLAYNKNINRNNFELISKVIQLQEKNGNNNCIICGKEDPSKGIIEWKKILTDKNIILKQKIQNQLNRYIEESQKIINDKKIYESVAKKTVENIENFIFVIHDILKKLELGNIELLEFPKKQDEKLTIDINKHLIAISNYLLKPYKDKIIFFNSAKNYFNNLINKKKNEIEKILEDNAEEHKKSINNILDKLGLSKEISIKIDRLGGQIKYSLIIPNGKISELSDGQKHKLALAVFLNSLKNHDLNHQILVFDDPVVAMDEYSYHLFKNYLINEIMTPKESSPNLLIMTHNFNYLYIQISNVITNQDLLNETKIIKIYSDKLRKMNIELFKLDDIALFKKAIKELQFNKQLIDISSLYDKIFREFLDLRLRLSGFPLNGNPSPEIETLNNTEDEKSKLKKINRNLCSCSKDVNITLEKAKNRFKLLIEALTLLGFDDYLSIDDEERISLLDNECEYEMKDIDIIINEVAQLLREDNKKNQKYKDYINHPRISFTKNVLSTSLDI